MGVRKFTVKELSTTRVYRGEITASDIRQRFHLPENAKITIHGDGVDDEVDIEDLPLCVAWELVTKGAV